MSSLPILGDLGLAGQVIAVLVIVTGLIISVSTAVARWYDWQLGHAKTALETVRGQYAQVLREQAALIRAEAEMSPLVEKRENLVAEMEEIVAAGKATGWTDEMEKAWDALQAAGVVASRELSEARARLQDAVAASFDR